MTTPFPSMAVRPRTRMPAGCPTEPGRVNLQELRAARTGHLRVSHAVKRLKAVRLVDCSNGIGCGVVYVYCLPSTLLRNPLVTWPGRTALSMCPFGKVTRDQLARYLYDRF